MINSGHIVIADIDDDPNSKAWSDQDYFAFRGVHAVQTSTHKIASEIQHHNPEVFVAKNNLESLGPIKPRKVQGERLRIFFGSLNRKAEWVKWLPSLNKAFAKSPALWEVSTIHDKSFHKNINLPNHQKTFTPTCDLATYRLILSKADIIFLPLENTTFNQYKSDLSAIEAAGLGLAILASPTIYAESVSQGLPAKLFSSEKDLLEIMHNWEKAPDNARLLGKRAQNWVAQNRMQADLVGKKEIWYRDLFARKDILTNDIHKREPLLNPNS